MHQRLNPSSFLETYHEPLKDKFHSTSAGDGVVFPMRVSPQNGTNYYTMEAPPVQQDDLDQSVERYLVLKISIECVNICL